MRLSHMRDVKRFFNALSSQSREAKERSAPAKHMKIVNGLDTFRK